MPISPKSAQRTNSSRNFFSSIPDDILLEILSFLDLRDILSLRRVCKQLLYMTRDRALWVHLAHREALDCQLPWPSFAFPFSTVPSKTIEEYTIRTRNIDKDRVPFSDSQKRKFVHYIRCPPNSAGILQVVKGRWLVIELRGDRLELWDLQRDLNAGPITAYKGLSEHIDGMSIAATTKLSTTVVFSTSDFKTVKLKVDLPHLGDSRSASSFVVVGTFMGYSGLLDSREELDVLLQSRSDACPLVRNVSTGSALFLGGCKRTRQVISARILEDHIVLAGSLEVEVYSIKDVNTLFTNSQGGGSAMAINPTQCIQYPEGKTFQHVSFLDSLPPRLGKLAYDFSLGMLSEGTCFRLQVQLGMGSDPAPSSSFRAVFNSRDPSLLAVCWGGSGQRVLIASPRRRGFWVVGIRDASDLRTSGDEARSVEWPATRRTQKDFLAGLAFDESSGLCVVALRSGLVWVDDWSRPPSSKATIPVFRRHKNKVVKPGRLGPSWRMLHPDPSWRILHPAPWPANVRPEQILPFDYLPVVIWSTEVDLHFPSVNNPECYGGARWFVNEALHIPGPATLVKFTTSVLSVADSPPSVKILQLESGRLIGVEWDGDFPFVRMFGSHFNLDALTVALGEHGRVRRVGGVDLELDGPVIQRYLHWLNAVDPGVDPDGHSISRHWKW